MLFSAIGNNRGVADIERRASSLLLHLNIYNEDAMMDGSGLDVATQEQVLDSIFANGSSNLAVASTALLDDSDSDNDGAAGAKLFQSSLYASQARSEELTQAQSFIPSQPERKLKKSNNRDDIMELSSDSDGELFGEQEPLRVDATSNKRSSVVIDSDEDI